MARITYSNDGRTPFERLLGHVPRILARWRDLEEALLASDVLDAEVKEQVRRTLAYGNGCEYCMAEGAPAEALPDDAQSVAVAFAEAVLQDHRTISDEQFAVLAEVFDDDEIAELCAFICFMTASQMFGAVLGLEARENPARIGIEHQ